MALTLVDYLKGRDKLYPKEWTPELEKNAYKILKATGGLLRELEIDLTTVEISSGYRPLAINNCIPNSAKGNSQHIVCLAIDLRDKGNILWHRLAAREDLLKKYDLWLENKTSTPTWVHLDLKDRGKHRVSDLWFKSVLGYKIDFPACKLR